MIKITNKILFKATPESRERVVYDTHLVAEKEAESLINRLNSLFIRDLKVLYTKYEVKNGVLIIRTLGRKGEARTIQKIVVEKSTYLRHVDDLI